MSKSLDTKIFETKEFRRDGLASANRHCLDHHRARDGLWTRSDVTLACGNFLSLLFEIVVYVE
jgi:hypothetical protein